MKKIPNLFQKDPTDLGRVINQLNESCKWIHDGYIATQKFDGTATAIIENKLYKRYDAKLKPSTVFEIGDSVIMKNKKPFLNGNVVDIIVNIEGNMITLKDNGIIIKEYLKLIYKSINSNQFLIIDDIDKELHSVLTSYLIEELHNTQNNSQFLLTSHDVTQMNNFDKDQVYIVEKDYYGITTCSSVSEFNGLHKKMTLENWYRQGRLGGIPHIKNT